MFRLNQRCQNLFCVSLMFVILSGCSTQAITTSPTNESRDFATLTSAPSAQEVLEIPTTPSLNFPKPTVTPYSTLILTPTSESLKLGNSYAPTISADGYYIAFISFDRYPNILLFNQHTKQIELISSNSTSPSISADGTLLAFASADGNVYVKDMNEDLTELISQSNSGQRADNISTQPKISSDGRKIAFISLAANLTESNTDGYWNVYVRDLDSGTTRLISKTNGGNPGDGDSVGPLAISADGRIVAFWSWAGNLVSGDIELCEGNTPYNCGDIFIYDQQLETLERIKVGRLIGLGGGGYELSISSDGRYIAYYNFIYDRETAEVVSYCEKLDERCGYSPSLSMDGQLLAFISEGQIFVTNLLTTQTEQVSLAHDGTPGDRESGLVWFQEGFFGSLALSEDGRWAVYSSLSTNLVPNDTKAEECQELAVITIDGPHCYDIYLHDLENNMTIKVSVPNP